MEPWTCIYMYLDGKLSSGMRATPYRRVSLMNALTRMRTSTFLSRSVNLIIVITVRRYATRLLRERFIWGHVTSRLRRGPSACVCARRLQCYVSAGIASRISRALCHYFDRSVSLQCSSDADYVNVDVGTASQPASSHPVYPKGNILSFASTRTRFRYIRVDVSFL